MRSTAARTLLVAAAVLLSGCTTLLDRVDGGPDVQAYGPSAGALVWGQPFSELVVEIDYVQDLEDRQPNSLAPSQEAIDLMTQALREETDKESITVLEPEPIQVDDPSPGYTWSFEEIQELRDQVFDAGDPDVLGEGQTAYLHILYLNGHREETAVVGFSTGTWLVLFPDQYDPSAGSGLPLGVPLPNPAPEKVERSVLVHEVGHSLGLVDNGAPVTEDRLHPDDECDCHSEFEDSVMYPFVRNRQAVLEFVQDNQHTPYRFDQHDKADLERLREIGRGEG